MTDALKGKTVEQARALFDQFHAMLTSNIDTPPSRQMSTRRVASPAGSGCELVHMVGGGGSTAGGGEQRLASACRNPV